MNCIIVRRCLVKSGFYSVFAVTFSGEIFRLATARSAARPGHATDRRHGSGDIAAASRDPSIIAVSCHRRRPVMRARCRLCKTPARPAAVFTSPPPRLASPAHWRHRASDKSRYKSSTVAHTLLPPPRARAPAAAGPAISPGTTAACFMSFRIDSARAVGGLSGAYRIRVCRRRQLLPANDHSASS